MHLRPGEIAERQEVVVERAAAEAKEHRSVLIRSFWVAVGVQALQFAEVVLKCLSKEENCREVL